MQLKDCTFDGVVSINPQTAEAFKLGAPGMWTPSFPWYWQNPVHNIYSKWAVLEMLFLVSGGIPVFFFSGRYARLIFVTPSLHVFIALLETETRLLWGSEVPGDYSRPCSSQPLCSPLFQSPSDSVQLALACNTSGNFSGFWNPMIPSQNINS